jgi:hypothetical protein
MIRQLRKFFAQCFHSNDTDYYGQSHLIAEFKRLTGVAPTAFTNQQIILRIYNPAHLPITSISIQCWLDRLNPLFRQIAITRLSEIAGLPLRT